MAKLTPEQREEMLKRYANGVPQSVLLRDYGVSAAHVQRTRVAAGLPRQRAMREPPRAADLVVCEPASLLDVLGTIRLTSRPVASGSMPASCFEEVPDGRP